LKTREIINPTKLMTDSEHSGRSGYSERPENLIELVQDIFERNEPLFHQCNCKTRRAIGLAKDVFSRYPYANIYTKLSERVPGVVYPCHGTRLILNACAQYSHGGPSSPRGNISNGEIVDDSEQRLQWFADCLVQAGLILNDAGYSAFAVPRRIGCGWAKGRWEDYYTTLVEFAKLNPHLKIYICQDPREVS
jgi:hypothetical protein